MTQALQDRSKPETSEDEVTKRLLRFMIWQIELTKRDPEWKETLKEKTEMFKVLDQ